MDEEKKSTYWKFVGVFLAIVFVVFAGIVGSRIYKRLAAADARTRAAEALKQAAEENYRKMAADTYGGKTPQETLAMYIDAVEKGDYVLASKYFVMEKQEAELESLQNSPKVNIDNILNLLKTGLGSEGSYSTNKDGYAIRRPILVDFQLYPSGTWKIIEI